MKNHQRRHARIFASAIFASLVLASPAIAQDGLEYGAGEGYHEEEWYEPSDWFDEDESISYEDDSWLDADSTDDYGYDYGYDYADYGYDYAEPRERSRPCLFGAAAKERRAHPLPWGRSSRLREDSVRRGRGEPRAPRSSRSTRAV